MWIRKIILSILYWPKGSFCGKPHHGTHQLLQCYVLIDLKTDKLKHQDLGQMQMKCELVDLFKQLLSTVIILLLIMLLLIILLHIFVQE